MFVLFLLIYMPNRNIYLIGNLFPSMTHRKYLKNGLVLSVMFVINLQQY